MDNSLHKFSHSLLAILLLVATTGVPAVVHNCSVMGKMAPFQTCGMDHSRMSSRHDGHDCCGVPDRQADLIVPSLAPVNCCTQEDETISVRTAFTAPSHDDAEFALASLHAVPAPPVPPATSPFVMSRDFNSDPAPPGSPPAYIFNSELLI